MPNDKGGMKNDGNVSRIPKGFCNKAQGCERRATLGNVRRRSLPTSKRLRRLIVCLIPDAGIVSWLCWHELHNSFGVEARTQRLPRVARYSQPWAGGQNPFGILSDFGFRISFVIWHSSFVILYT